MYLLEYRRIILLRTEEFARWLASVRDREAKARIQMRLDRMELGLEGDAKPVGRGVSELRIPHGPGYRVYFVRTRLDRILLLTGGIKRDQQSDIRRALMLAHSLKEDADD
jgi:putative addiction module killer protein